MNVLSWTDPRARPPSTALHARRVLTKRDGRGSSSSTFSRSSPFASIEQEVETKDVAMASYVLPLALLLLLLGCTVSAEVVSLTDATFADKVKEKDTVWFIKFFAPWCGHCTRLAPTWKELGAALEAEDGVEVAHVDCTTSKDTCTKADVRSYPTLKLFYNGEEYKKYSGPRDLESLKKFAIDAAAEIVKANNEGEQADVM